jgi:hypothetical protein
MWKDEIIAGLHQSREAHARRFNFDLPAICADLQAQEKNSGRRFVSLAPRPARLVVAQPMTVDWAERLLAKPVV